MKNIIKSIALISCILIGTSLCAQSERNVSKTITKKVFEIDKNGTTYPYELTILEKRKFQYKIKEEDKGKLNQDKILLDDKVSKFIYINTDFDNSLDRYIVLRYNKSPEDSFELIPTKKGFGVKVDDRYFEYIFGEGIYFVNNEDRDFFIVEEFDVI